MRFQKYLTVPTLFGRIFGGGGSFRGNDRSKSPACTEKKMLDFLGEVFVGVVFGIVPSHVDGYLAFKNSA